MRGFYKDSELETAIKDVKDIAAGNRQQGDVAHWVVYNEEGDVVCTGYIDDNGNNSYNDEYGPDQYYHSLPCIPVDWDE